MNILFCSCIILTNKFDEVLICQRPLGKFMEGFWEFPGGKVKNGEKFNSDAAREIKEELDVSVKTEKLYFLMNIFYEYPEHFLSMQVYVADLWQGKIKGMDKQKFKWIKKEELKDFNMLPASKSIIKKILSRKNLFFPRTNN